MKRSFCLSACVLLAGILLGGCASAPSGPSVLNQTAGVSASWSGSEIELKRGKDRQVVAAFHPVHGMKLHSAASAPVLLAVIDEEGYEGMTLLRIQLPPEGKSLSTLQMKVTELSGKTVVRSVESLSEDGRFAVITAGSDPKQTVRLKADLLTGKVTDLPHVLPLQPEQSAVAAPAPVSKKELKTEKKQILGNIR